MRLVLHVKATTTKTETSFRDALEHPDGRKKSRLYPTTKRSFERAPGIYMSFCDGF